MVCEHACGSIKGGLGVVAVEQGVRQGCVLAPLLFKVFFEAIINKRGLHAFQGGQRHHGRFGAPEEEKGGGGGATDRVPVLATLL